MKKTIIIMIAILFFQSCKEKEKVIQPTEFVLDIPRNSEYSNSIMRRFKNSDGSHIPNEINIGNEDTTIYLPINNIAYIFKYGKNILTIYKNQTISKEKDNTNWNLQFYKTPYEKAIYEETICTYKGIIVFNESLLSQGIANRQTVYVNEMKELNFCEYSKVTIYSGNRKSLTVFVK